MSNRVRILLTVVGFIIVLLSSLYFARHWIQRQFFKPTGSTIPVGVIEPGSQEIQVVAEGLNIPWEIAFMPDGDMLVTERPGSLKRIGNNHQTYQIAGVQHKGEGGLLGLALHPEFDKNNYLYLYLTRNNGNRLINRVERYMFKDDALYGKTTILDNIPGASYHDGGRMAFGPDGLLYITTGDAGVEDLAQDTKALAGKILRINPDGSVPQDNPFGNAVYSYGHRNAQGLAWDEDGQLWVSEHGPSGTESGWDELNRIEKGKNYGWPVIRGSATQDGMVTPVAESGSNDTWAPSGMAYTSGSLFFSGLRGETLYQAKIVDNNTVKLTAHLREKYGRLRAVVIGPDGLLYVSTSNHDGRGNPAKDDDKIIRLNPSIFK